MPLHRVVYFAWEKHFKTLIFAFVCLSLVQYSNYPTRDQSSISVCLVASRRPNQARAMQKQGFGRLGRMRFSAHMKLKAFSGQAEGNDRFSHFLRATHGSCLHALGSAGDDVTSHNSSPLSYHRRFPFTSHSLTFSHRLIPSHSPMVDPHPRCLTLILAGINLIQDWWVVGLARQSNAIMATIRAPSPSPPGHGLLPFTDHRCSCWSVRL